MNRYQLYLLFAIFTAMIVGVIVAGCDDSDNPAGPEETWAWKPLSYGMNGDVHAIGVYNDKLYVGGDFLTGTPGGGVAKNIAAWDGTEWAPLGDGTNTPTFALTVYDGRLIAGGAFQTAGTGAAASVAAYDGVSWSAMGAGLPGLNVRDLCVHHDSLFAVGTNQNPSDPELFVAVWDGSTWARIDSASAGYAKAVCVFQDALVVGGEYLVESVLVPYAKMYIGSLWIDIRSEDLPDGVHDLLVVNDGLYVAGGGFYPLRSLWQSWDTCGTEPFGPGADVYSLGEFNGDLVVAGSFATIGADSFGNIALWDGSAWSPLGAGITAGSYILCMTQWHDDLYVGGSFTEAGGVAANHIARWCYE